MKKQLTALMTAAALALGAAPMIVLAEETMPNPEVVTKLATPLPEWVPTDYASAVDFCNDYGTTHVQDGYVCLVRRGMPDSDMHKGFVETASEEPLTQFIPQYSSIYLDGEDRDKDRDVDGPAPFMQDSPLYQFEITVYQPKGSELKITWAKENDPDNGTTFTFGKTTSGSFEETDIFGWLPDCRTEYSQFAEKNPEVSIHNGYIVFAANPCYDGGFRDYLSIVGTGAVEQVMSYHVPRLYNTSALPAGDSSPVVKVFRPTRAGDLQIIASERRSWKSDDPVYSDPYYFTIAEDLTVKAAKQFAQLFGDCNGDGELSVLDLVAMRKYLHGMGELAKPELADLDGDGQVDIFDFALLRQRLFVQTPWENTAKVDFTTEHAGTDVNAKYKQENRAYTAQTYFSYDALMKNLPSQTKEGDSYTPGLKTITKDTFQDHAVILLTSPTGAGNRQIKVTGIERTGSALTLYVNTYHEPIATPDMVSFYKLLVVDKSIAENGVRKTVVKNTDIHPLPVTID